MKIRKFGGTWFRQPWPEKNQKVIARYNVKDIVRFDNSDTIITKAHKIKIGRNETNNIILDDPWTSRMHAKIEKHVFGHWTITDLNSTNGTFIKRGDVLVKLIDGRFPIEKGDIIILGELKQPNTKLDIVDL